MGIETLDANKAIPTAIDQSNGSSLNDDSMTVFERIAHQTERSAAWFVQVCVTFNHVLHKETTTKERNIEEKGANKDISKRETLLSVC
jgi:hypothetical protein